MNNVIEKQRAYFASGATRSVVARKTALRQLQKSILAHQKQICAALESDLGKSDTESYMSEIATTLSEISYAFKHLRRWTKTRHPHSILANFPSRQKIICEPYGVVLILAPWNYPFYLSIVPLIGALAAGNCCILKPSSDAPATAELLQHLLRDTFPTELVTVICGGVAESQALLEEKFDYIFYTGNGRVGRYIMERAAQHLTPVTLELGGKSPVIIAQSAPLRLVARRIVFGKFLNCGQTCVAPDYILVVKAVHDELVQYLKEEIVLQYGTSPLQNAAYGRIINRRHYDRLSILLDPGKVVYGGNKDETTLQIAPTILDNISPHDLIMQEEIFGPLLPIICVEDTEEAIRFVKAQDKPLALYLFAKDKPLAERVFHEIPCGGGCVNDVLSHIISPNLPFGGIGASGMGAYHGKSSFDTFSHKKAVVCRGTWCDPIIRYQPYTQLKRRLLKYFL